MTKKTWLGAVALGLVAGCAAGDDDATVDAPPPSELAKMTEFVGKRIDPQAVMVSLATKDGRRVDCIDIAKQPALHGGKLEAPPAELALTPPSPAEAAARKAVGPETLFDSAGAAATCPAGTVPVPEVTLADVSRFASLDDYFAKEPRGARGTTLPAIAGDGTAPPHYGPTAYHQYAHAYRYVTNWGAETSISIPSQTTELDSEFSLGQIWVVAGSGSGLQTLEVGLQHYKNLYGDYNPHLFIYSTRGGYAPGTGCYNNSCGDFVQVSSTWFPGMGIGPVSVPGGAQYEINAHWAKAGDTGAWWLSVQGEWVGYYPRSLYTAAINHAQVIDFGGEIIDGRNGGRHTMTDMGTGAFASAGWTQAAFMRRIRFNDSNPYANAITWAEATGLTPTQDDPACYSIDLLTYNDPDWHYYFWYGGPGYSNPGCL